MGIGTILLVIIGLIMGEDPVFLIARLQQGEAVLSKGGRNNWRRWPLARCKIFSLWQTRYNRKFGCTEDIALLPFYCLADFGQGCTVLEEGMNVIFEERTEDNFEEI